MEHLTAKGFSVSEIEPWVNISRFSQESFEVGRAGAVTSTTLMRRVGVRERRDCPDRGAGESRSGM